MYVLVKITGSAEMRNVIVIIIIIDTEGKNNNNNNNNNNKQILRKLKIVMPTTLMSVQVDIAG